MEYFIIDNDGEIKKVDASFDFNKIEFFISLDTTKCRLPNDWELDYERRILIDKSGYSKSHWIFGSDISLEYRSNYILNFCYKYRFWNDYHKQIIYG